MSDTDGELEKEYFDKRKSIGLSDSELKRRKALKLAAESGQVGVEQDFFGQATAGNLKLNLLIAILEKKINSFFLELNRIKEQRRHAMEVAALEDHVETLRRELENKDKLINMLRQVLLEKTELINALGNAQIPKELLVNWSAMQKMYQLPSSSSI